MKSFAWECGLLTNNVVAHMVQRGQLLSRQWVLCFLTQWCLRSDCAFLRWPQGHLADSDLM